MLIRKRCPILCCSLATPRRFRSTFSICLMLNTQLVGLDLIIFSNTKGMLKALLTTKQERRWQCAQILVWGTRHPEDMFTDLSPTYLTMPLCKGDNDEPALGAKQGFSLRTFAGKEATKANLLNVLRCKEDRNPPAILFTTSHGMGWPKEDPKGQKNNQGALLCQDWKGIGTISSSQYLTAAEIPGDANVQGIVTLIAACYSAGVPAYDAFLQDRKQGPLAISNEPFISALPQHLLSHPNGGALAVIGHVERLWSLSFVPPGCPSQLTPFRNFFGRVMSGEPIGHAMSDFNKRYAVLAAELLKNLDETQPDAKISDTELVWKWIERTDAQNFVVLGDPAACVRVNDLRAPKLRPAHRGRRSGGTQERRLKVANKQKPKH